MTLSSVSILLALTAIAAHPAAARDGARQLASKAHADSVKLPAKLYDFKGVPLEISMEDFRKLPNPDGSPAKVVCTGEKIGDLVPMEPVYVMVFDEAELKLGVKKCIWIETAHNFLKGSQASLSLANSGYATYDYSFSFIPDPKDGVMRLYKFAGTSNAAAMSKVVSALTAKFGTPKIENDKVQNQIGNSFDQTTANWLNPLSSLTVQDRFSKIDDMGIVLVDNRLAGLVAREKAAEEAAEPNAI